jgi:hypothetical protein
MNLKNTSLIKISGVGLILLGLVSCNDTVPRRTTISPSQVISDNDSVCEEGQTEEVTVDEATGEETVTCVSPPPTRPTGAVIFKSDFCGCIDGKAVTYGNCSSFCSGQKTDSKEIFFANFTVTADIALSGLGNVANWCTLPLEGDESNPKCELEAKTDEGTSTNLEVTVIPGSNSVKVDITDLPNDKTLVLTLIESGSKARSNSIQIVKYSPDIGIPILGPLKNGPISQYTCVIREFSTLDTTGDLFFTQMSRMHFYFIPRIPPNPVVPGVSNLICHDIFNPLFGIVDDMLYPRLELLPGVFNLWDNTDPRFFDNNGNSLMDVDEIVIQKTKNFGGSIPSSAKFFSPFDWPGQPDLSDDAGNNSSQSQPLGFFMAPWIDNSSFKSFCLNNSHYNSNNPLFKALRDVIGVETEGIYIGQKAPEAVTLADGTITSGEQDFILIREEDLKQVWFHLNNGVPTAPTEENVANVAVFFYYPLNYDSPFVKTSTQRIYRVMSGSELSATGSTSTSGASKTDGSPTSFPPHDRKIGCIPKF